MIRRSPAEYYIKYLLLNPKPFGDVDIEGILKEHQLDYPAAGYLGRLRSRLKIPKPFYPYNEQHKSSHMFLVSEKVHTMFFPDVATEGALDLLFNPKAKELVEAMAIIREPLPFIATRLQRLGLGTFTVGEIKRFLHFFWNVDLVDNTELRTLIVKRAKDLSLVDNDRQTRLVSDILEKAIYTDPRFMATQSPVPIVAALRLQVRFGFSPTRIDTAQLAELGSKLAAAGAVEAGALGGPKAAEQMRDYATAAKELQGLREMLGTPDESIRKDLHQMAIRTSEEVVPSVDELTDGHYSDGYILTEGTEVKNE